MSNSTKERPAKAKRGRPQSIPWEDEIDFLVAQRKAGVTYADLAWELEQKYNKHIAAQSVRAKVTPYITEAQEAKGQAIREKGREEALDQEALQIAEFIVEHQRVTKDDIAEGLDIPVYKVDMLYDRAKTMLNGYIIPPAREGKEKFTNKEMESILKKAAQATGAGKGGTLSEGAFIKWRDSFSAKQRDAIPNSQVYRRRYGTWTNACQAAGLAANRLPREYDGVSDKDCIVWLAHWLRSLTNRREGLIDASQGEYQMWIRDNPGAPSQEMLRLRGMWNKLLTAASVYDNSHKTLPKPKPVQTTYRKKKARKR